MQKETQMQAQVLELEPKIVKVFTDKIPTKSEDIVLKEFVTDLAQLSYSYPIEQLFIATSVTDINSNLLQLPKQVYKTAEKELRNFIAETFNKATSNSHTARRYIAVLRDIVGLTANEIGQVINSRDSSKVIQAIVYGKEAKSERAIQRIQDKISKFVSSQLTSLVNRQKQIYAQHLQPYLNVVQPLVKDTKMPLYVAAVLQFADNFDEFLQRFLDYTTVYFNSVNGISYGFGSKLELFKGYKQLVIGHEDQLYIFTAKRTQSTIQWILLQKQLQEPITGDNQLFICKWFDSSQLKQIDNWLGSLLILAKFSADSNVLIANTTDKQAEQIEVDGLPIITELADNSTDIVVETNLFDISVIKHKSALLTTDENTARLYQINQGIHYTLDKSKYTLFANLELLKKRVNKIYSAELQLKVTTTRRTAETEGFSLQTDIRFDRKLVNDLQQNQAAVKVKSGSNWFDFNKKYKNPILQTMKAAALSKDFNEFRSVVTHLIQDNTVTEDYDSLVYRGIDLFTKHLPKYGYKYFEPKILQEILNTDEVSIKTIRDYLYEVKGLYKLAVDYSTLRLLGTIADYKIEFASETFEKLLNIYYSYTTRHLTPVNVQYKLNRKRLLTSYHIAATLQIPLDVLYVEHVVLFPLITISPLLLQAYRINTEDYKFIERLLHILS